MTEQAQRFGADFEFGECSNVDFSSRPYKITTNSNVIRTKTLIIATGMFCIVLNSHKLNGLSSCSLKFWTKSKISVHNLIH